MKRCGWVDLNKPLYVDYHDKEWGVPRYDDEKLYEMLLLECFQAGLSWYSILVKRESFGQCFAAFDPNKVALFDEEQIEELMTHKEIIRNRAKIKAAITNSRVFLEIQKEFGSFSNYLWGFTEGKIIVNTTDEIKTISPLSDQLSKDLKNRGMKFVGSITIYSYLQAVGIVNDHETTCFRYKELVKEQMMG